MSSPVAAIASEPKTGGHSNQVRVTHNPREWEAVGILYVRCGKPSYILVESVLSRILQRVQRDVEFRLLYQSEIPQEVKDKIAERFGVGALEWEVAR